MAMMVTFPFHEGLEFFFFQKIYKICINITDYIHILQYIYLTLNIGTEYFIKILNSLWA